MESLYIVYRLGLRNGRRCVGPGQSADHRVTGLRFRAEGLCGALG